MLIDLHAHVVPRHFPAAGDRPDAHLWPCNEHLDGDRAQVMIDGRNFRTITSANWDVERRLHDMAAHGADAQILSPMPELLSYWFEPSSGRDLNRFVNEQIAAMCEAAPGRFFGLGAVPLQDPTLAAAELARVKALGLRGIEVGSNVNGAYLGEDRFREFFAEVARLELCVFVHSLKPTMAGVLPAPSMVNPILFPTETCLTIASLIGSGTAAAVPGLRIAFSHGGGTFPFLLPRYENQWRGTWNEAEPAPGTRRGTDAPEGPAALARRFFYDTLLFDRRAIRYLVDLMGASQVVVGTDYPYFPPEVPADASLRSLGLPETSHRAITWDNAFRFLGLEPPPG
ncbi:MAG: amidohydrolase family protein [Acidimicrobiales bacterium]